MWLVCSKDPHIGIVVHQKDRPFDTKLEAINRAKCFAANYPGREYFIFKWTHVVKFEGVTVTEVGED